MNYLNFLQTIEDAQRVELPVEAVEPAYEVALFGVEDVVEIADLDENDGQLALVDLD